MSFRNLISSVALLSLGSVPGGASASTLNSATFTFAVDATLTEFYAPDTGYTQLFVVRKTDALANLVDFSKCNFNDMDGSYDCFSRSLRDQNIVSTAKALGEPIIGYGADFSSMSGTISITGDRVIGCTGGLTTLRLCDPRDYPNPNGPNPTVRAARADANGFSASLSSPFTTEIFDVSSLTAMDDEFVGRVGPIDLRSLMSFKAIYTIETALIGSTQPIVLIAPVPLPATLPLLAGAFAAAGVFARRKRRVSRP